MLGEVPYLKRWWYLSWQSPYFKMYSQYINNIDRQERLFVHLIKTNGDFRTFCDSVRALPDSKSLDLPAFLAKVRGPLLPARWIPPVTSWGMRGTAHAADM